MVLGLGGKSRKGSSVQVEYLVHVQEINPWPIAQHLKAVKSVMLQWENDGQNSGFFTSDVGDEKIFFGECFRLPVTLCKETSKKKASTDGYQKNFLEFFVYEARKEKTEKGQLLGSAVINLADFGVIQETMAIKTPLNFKKNSKHMTQSLLYITFQPSDAPKDSSSLDKDGGTSVSGSKEYDGEVDFAAFTDDDDDGVSSHSSQYMSSAFHSQRHSQAQSNKVGDESVKDVTARINGKPATLTGQALKQSEVIPVVQPIRSSSGTNTDLRIGMNPTFATSSYNQTTFRADDKALKIGDNKVSNSNHNFGGIEDKEHDIEYEEEVLDISKHTFKDKASQKQVTSRSSTIQVNRKTHGGQSRAIASNKLKHVMSNQFPSNPVNNSEQLGNSTFSVKAKHNDNPVDDSIALKSYATNGSKDKHNVLSTRKVEQKPKADMRKDANPLAMRDRVPNSSVHSITGGSKHVQNVTSKYNSDMESEVESLVEELREAAAMEAGLYSAVAEHGSSTSKVHAPARRLSRFYVHAYKSPQRRASAARTAVSGFILVSKACGNDVARLSFWLSNAIILRAIVSQDASKCQHSAGHYTNNNKAATIVTNSLASRRQDSSFQNDLVEPSFDWEDPQSFIVALEKVEAWIFYRIVESVWWQSMTPHMQSAAAKASSSRKANGKKYGLGDQDQGSFSIDIWKRAFKDACERLCPTRAGGHECGCLPLLARLVMEQLVNRLDVAMFNAILRESAEEMPTDPVSDPISDAKVLPIPVGKSSFGSGAQLKNAAWKLMDYCSLLEMHKSDGSVIKIGNWSRWLTDLFGIDDSDAADDNNEPHDCKALERESPFKPFHLLNALSGLMMLPFEMLADKATRKEVCPLFDAPMIKRVLNNFSPDEFCPTPVPEELYAALDSEEAEDARGECIADFPCSASPTVYSAPSTASVLAAIGEGGSQTLLRGVSSVLKKSNTSDDELDELESPLASIALDTFRISPTSSIPNWMLKGKGARKVVRYQLLREAWRGNI